MTDWMIYGATGYTGQLVAEKAVQAGMRPLLAGRSAARLAPLAERLGLEYVAVDLADEDALAAAVGRVRLVYHAAGPFVHTAEPMLRACLQAGTHYVDITGELPVFQRCFALDAAARERGILILPGAGFDVIPSDCLLKYAADALPGAERLVLALNALGASDGKGSGASAGTLKSSLELLPRIGSVERRSGELVPIPFGYGARRFRFLHGEFLCLPIPWGDLETAWRSTGVPNITTYLSLPPLAVHALGALGPLLLPLLKIDGLRQTLSRFIERTVPGPTPDMRAIGRSYLYAAAGKTGGEKREAWLETAEGYEFTALAAPRVVERVLASDLAGAMTPAQAFGADFVLSIPGTRRFDSLPTIV